MTNRAAKLKQSELKSYAKAMRDAGISEWRVLIRPDGTQEIVVGAAALNETANPCDRLLK